MAIGTVMGWIASCNGILDNDPRRLAEGTGAAAGHDPSAETGGQQAGGAGGTIQAGGGMSADGGAAAGAAGADVHGGSAGSPGSAGSAGNAGSAGSAGNGSGAESGAGEPATGGKSGTGGAPTVCPTPVNCALAICNGLNCDTKGRRCAGGVCACPGNATSETACSDGVDNDCDGLVDCADPNCDHAQCQAGAANRRCCSKACVDLESDEKNCQGCGVACHSGETCVLVSDSSGRRGACTCSLTNSFCPGSDSICRTDTPNSNRCAQVSSAGCPAGQTFVDVSGGPNFCHY